MSGNIYLDLVKVFYTNLHIDGENLSSHVKRVDKEITLDVDCYNWVDVCWVED